MRDAHNLDLSHDVGCKSRQPKLDYWTIRTWDHACINSRIEVHVRCVEGVLRWDALILWSWFRTYSGCPKGVSRIFNPCSDGKGWNTFPENCCCVFHTSKCRHCLPAMRGSAASVPELDMRCSVVSVHVRCVEFHHADIVPILVFFWDFAVHFLYLLLYCFLSSSIILCCQLLHTFASREWVIGGVVFTPPVRYSRPINDPSVTK